MENADVRTMRLVLLPSSSISNYEKFTASDKVFLNPSAIKGDTPEPPRLVDLPRACMREFKSSAFVSGKCFFFPLRSHYMCNLWKLQFFKPHFGVFQLKGTLPPLHAIMLHVWLASYFLKKYVFVNLRWDHKESAEVIKNKVAPTLSLWMTWLWLEHPVQSIREFSWPLTFAQIS